MPDNPPPASPAQDDDIPTIHINIPSCYLQPTDSVVPQLPDGTFPYDAQEDYWKPSPNDPKRQEFRIRGKNEFVFIAGAQYTYKPNTSLHIKCKKATFMPHPTDPSQKMVMVRMPGADAEQNLPAKAGDGKCGTTASFQLAPYRGAFTGHGEAFTSVEWRAMLIATDGATEGGAGDHGATGSQGADAGSLTIEADSYDTSALADDDAFFIADCTGGRGQQGGDGGDGGGGGKGVDTAGPAVEYISSVIDKRFTFQGQWHSYDGKKRSDAEYQELIVNGFLGAQGGAAGRQGAGGYGGSGGQFTINLPKESAGDDRLKGRFGLRSNVGTPGTTGEAGEPGPGGRCGDSPLLKFPAEYTSKDKLDGDLRSKLELDWSSDTVNKWAAYLVGGTEPSPVKGEAARALDEEEIENARYHAGQHKPMTNSNVVFNESK